MKTLSNVDLSVVTGGASPRWLQRCRDKDVLAGKTAGLAAAEPGDVMSPREWRQLSTMSTESADRCFANVLRRR